MKKEGEMKFLRKIFFVCVLLVLPMGCSNLNCTPFELLLGGDVDLVNLGEEVADELVKHSFPPLIPKPPGQPVLIVSLLNNDNLEESSSFGRVLQDHIASRFVQQGYAVKEVKLRSNLLIRQGDGEFMLSRRLGEISTKQNAQAVVVGTYSLANRILYLSVRLVNPGDQMVRATWDARLCLDESSLQMLGLQYQTRDEVEPPSRSFLDKIF